MALPLITANMEFDIVLKAIETVLAAESANQITLAGTGWKTTRERFDPWDLGAEGDAIVNVSFNAASFDGSKGGQYDQTNDGSYSVDCYALGNATETAGVIIPKDQRAADILHALITKVYYTLMSPLNRDMGLTPGTITRPWVSRIEKFIPTESNIPLNGIIAARLSLQTAFKEFPPLASGVDLDVIGVTTDTDAGGLLEQEFNVNP